LKKVLITGACGYLGARISKYLAKGGYKVTAFDSYDPSAHIKWVSLMDEVVVGDIRDESTIGRLSTYETQNFGHRGHGFCWWAGGAVTGYAWRCYAYLG
jgi:nucleoside-diphosphate-sugar epimerase